ncbi:aldehyde dehydrogenase family protein [Streptomyces antimycoticus]|uniref:aldehyde dehydrogenase family protein n=1 Tax=Streptomyces antimycoticus TaxID=68175 RepID=UPI00191BB812|nr:aldehyde dehydrogenase family protein [Streptomyces antimycoticus]
MGHRRPLNTGPGRSPLVRHQRQIHLTTHKGLLGEYTPKHTSYTRREPVGVCAQLAPWNFPLLMAVLKAAPAIAAGNTVVLKPAHTTPSSALMLADLATRIPPPGVLNVVCGGPATGRLMVEHPVPAAVSLTGSVAAGVDVATRAAATLKRTHLELGGKTPVLVCADADISDAARTIVTGAVTNAGQDCTAASRVLVVDAAHGPLLEALVAEASTRRPGPPSEPGSAYGPLNNPEQLARVRGCIDALPPHARVVTGGHEVGAPRLLLRSHRHRRSARGRRHHTYGDLRPRDHRRALH